MRSLKAGLASLTVLGTLGATGLALHLSTVAASGDESNCTEQNYVALATATGANALTSYYAKTDASLPGIGAVIPVSSVVMDSEQTLNIGSGSTQSGAGKVTFNPISFTKSIDTASPYLFSAEASGTAFATATFYSGLCIYSSTSFTAKTTVKLGGVYVKTIKQNLSDNIENVALDYWAKFITVRPQLPDGSLGKGQSAGWNRVKNGAWNGTTPIA